MEALLARSAVSRPALALALACGCATVRPGAPEDAGALLTRAQEDLAAGRSEAAQRGFEAVLQREPRSLPAIRGRVEVARRRGVLAQISLELEAAARDRPEEASAWYALGLARFAQAREAEAVAALSRAAELKPGEADIQYRLGIALFDGEKFSAARGPLQQAVDLSPQAARYRIPLAACLDRLGERKAALEALRAIPALSPGADDGALAVKAARTLTDPFREVPQPARVDLEAALGYLGRDAAGLAVEPLESLAERFPDLAAAHLLLGLAAERLDEAGRAVGELKRAAELAPDLPQPHAYLAELYEAKDRPELAAAEYAAALERNPLEVDTLRKLGVLQLERAGQPAQALVPLRQAAALAAADGGLQLLLARAELAGGQTASGRTRLERLAEQRPEDPEVLLRLAAALFDERAKSTEPARRELTHRVEKLVDRVLTLQPQNASASRILTALKAG